MGGFFEAQQWMNHLNNLEAGARHLVEQGEIDESVLFSPAFLSRYSPWTDVDDMFEHLPGELDILADVQKLSDEKKAELNRAIQSATGFSDWETFVAEAEKFFVAARAEKESDNGI
ncbi:hypothetical protein B0H94_10332 [Salsuginibacillus halophilus]|uniref:Uncharacterized protein n=1 Tax=Salsuginibacillus halophilus TaxID=517424 RepID=A0A2P8HVZ6_9BACI|nr:hypothetical protein [Salsuginibacillus halophilus]PSL50421.1 hypothetical protein B0H94_10332 [Salsuginibacillus halophilus]